MAGGRGGGGRLQWSLQLCLKGLGNPSFFSGRYTKGAYEKKGTLQVKRAELLFGARGAGFVTQSHSPLALSDYIKVPGNCRS